MYQILVAEDEAIERKALCANLQKNMGSRCVIHEARNGREAVELFERFRPQVAILDIEMPGISGLEAAHRIRQSGSPCMILFLTAFDKFEYAREAITLRAMDYLLKPYQEQELILTVEEALHLYDRLGGMTDSFLRGTVPEPAGEEELADRRMAMIRENIECYIREHYSTEISRTPGSGSGR